MNSQRKVYDREEYIKTSQDFFSKKHQVSKNNVLSPIKNSNYMTLVNVMKTDIIQIENLIKKYSDILSLYKIDNSNSNIQITKKCVKLTEKNEIFKNLENAKNMELLYKHFNCISKDDLIYRLAFEFYLNDLFINKINDLAFLINLKQFNENNQFVINYKENLSKFFNLKFLIDMINISFEDAKSITGNISNISIDEESLKLDDDFGKVLEMNNINELFEYKTDNPILNHIKCLMNKFYDKAFYILNDMIKEYNKKLNLNIKIFKTEDFIGNLFTIREGIERIINFIIANDEMKILKLENEYNELQNKYDTCIKNNENISNLIKKVESDTLKIQNNINLLKDNTAQLLYDDMKDFEIQNKKLKNELTQLKFEFSLLEKKLKIQDLNSSFENLLIEQFDSMKKSFLLRIDTLTSDYIKNSNEMKKEINRLNQEIIISNQMKDLFMTQYMTLKKSIL